MNYFIDDTSLNKTHEKILNNVMFIDRIKSNRIFNTFLAFHLNVSWNSLSKVSGLESGHFFVVWPGPKWFSYCLRPPGQKDTSFRLNFSQYNSETTSNTRLCSWERTVSGLMILISSIGTCEFTFFCARIRRKNEIPGPERRF
jgi:hypothetical protein